MINNAFNPVHDFTMRRVAMTFGGWREKGLTSKAAKAAAALEIRNDSVALSAVRDALPYMKARGSVAYGISLRVLRGAN